jgi:hypothetical protein
MHLTDSSQEVQTGNKYSKSLAIKETKNTNKIEIPSHPSQNGCHQENKHW